MAEQPRKLIGLIKAFKGGSVKLEQIRPGMRVKVQRMAADMTPEQLNEYGVARPPRPVNMLGERQHFRARAD